MRRKNNLATTKEKIPIYKKAHADMKKHENILKWKQKEKKEEKKLERKNASGMTRSIF